MPEKFMLEADGKIEECRIITSLYSENRKKHYLIYEYVNNVNDDIFVSSYDPDSDDDYDLNDVTEPDELAEVTSLLDKYMEE